MESLPGRERKMNRMYKKYNGFISGSGALLK